MLGCRSSDTSADDSAGLSFFVEHIGADESVAEQCGPVLDGDCGDHAVPIEGMQV